MTGNSILLDSDVVIFCGQRTMTPQFVYTLRYI